MKVLCLSLVSVQIFAFSTFIAFSSYLQIINLAWCRANREMFNSLN